MNCERCQRPKFNPRSGSAPDCLREAYPDNTAVAATCNRLWAERLERQRDEALQLLRELFDHDTVIDWRMSDKAFAIARCDRFWALLARFPVNP